MSEKQQDSREHASLVKIWAVFVWEAGIPPLAKMSTPSNEQSEKNTVTEDTCDENWQIVSRQ